MIAAIAATGSLLVAALVVGWPMRVARHRHRRLSPAAPVPGRRGWWARSWWEARPLWQALRRWLSRHGSASPRRGSAPALVPGLSPVAGWFALIGVVVVGVRLGGPVAGAAGASYGVVAWRTLRQHQRRRERVRSRVDLLDALDAAAADLRAGLPAGTALAGLELTPPAQVPHPAQVSTSAQIPTPARDLAVARDPLRSTVSAAAALAERTGAPLASVLARIEADARRSDRSQAAVAAQAAGAQATAGLLAVLPAAGLALGYAIGADPLSVLLRTPVGMACGFSALALQLTGLAWCRRLIAPSVNP